MDTLVKTFVALGFVVGLWGSALAAPIADVTQPTDTIVLVHGQDDGDGQISTGGGDNPPPNETVEKAIDNDSNTKYLNFLDLNSGFRVTLDSYGPAPLTGIALTTANDSPPRDPASVTITGSNNGADWLPIVTDLPTPLPDDRFTDTEFGFSPLTPGAFLMYEVIFPTLKDAGNANSMQIGEVRLLPEPATLALLGLGVIGLAARRRRA